MASCAANAASVRMDYGTYHSGNGGEFKATPIAFPFTPRSLVGDGTFSTFCLETNEYFSPGSTYHVTFDPYAIKGGTGGGNPDPLSDESAYLYLKFITGTLNDFNYADAGGTRASVSSAALQAALWSLEDETGATANLNPDALAQATAWITQAHQAVQGGYRNDGSVFVMNLYDANGNNSQSQIVSQVPAPAAFGAGLVGMFGLSFGRRRHA
ncbi:MAG: hypothetical protein JNM07_12010 [Phycisphaerae bacterium]|nr:hypothetical protein [Phycisphaerae bacterium]